MNPLRPSRNPFLPAAVPALIAAIACFSSAPARADDATANNALRIVGKYSAAFTKVPSIASGGQLTDAPLLGNGDLGVSIQGNVNNMAFLLGKNEFWSLRDGSVRAMARLNLSIPGMAGAGYSMNQNIATGEVTGSFGLNGNTLATQSWVQADNSVDNLLITRFTYTGSGTKTVSVNLAVGNQNNYGNTPGSTGDVLTLDVKADNADMAGAYPTCKVRVAARVFGAAGTVANNALSFTLAPGSPVTLVASIMSNYDGANYQTRSIGNVTSLNAASVDSLNRAQRGWWSAFYAKSYVEIPNKLLEKEFYGLLYLLACSSRTGEAAPGLWGNWVMQNPDWNSDYTLNYNYESAFYMAFPTNHPELADSYDKPIIDWAPNAQALAKQHGWTGAYYCVHIGPMPNGSADKNEWNQKSMGPWAATVMLMHYYHTADLDYAKKIYPTIQQMATFNQNYLTWDGKRWVEQNDAQQEGDPNPQTNGVMSLGLIRFLFQGAIDMSKALDLDEAQRAIWQERLDHLSAFPTFVRNGKTVFRWTETGVEWVGGNDIGAQHIFPGSQIGLGSDPTLLQTGVNMIDAMQRWGFGNVTFFPAAARVGYNSATIMTQLNTWVANNTYPNLFSHTGGGGVENVNTVPNTICEMLLQTFQDTARFFADWPAGTNAKFGDLLGYGGFLISSDIRGNAVQYARVVSRKGGAFNFLNPWPGQTVRIYRNGQDAGTSTGNKIAVATSSGETIHIAPDGTSLTEILRRMNVALDGSIIAIHPRSQADAPGVSLRIAKNLFRRSLDGQVSFFADSPKHATRELSVRILNAEGKRVGELRTPGNRLDWDMKNRYGSAAAAGLYAYRLQWDGSGPSLVKTGTFRIRP